MTFNKTKYQRDLMRQRRAAAKEEQPASTRHAQIEAEMEKSFREGLERLEAGLKTTQPGSNAHLKYAEAIDDLKRKHRAERATRGLDPDQLGGAQKGGWHFICRILRGGSVSTAEVPEHELERVLAQERKKCQERNRELHDPERKAFEAKLNAEYGLDQITGADLTDGSAKGKNDDDE